MPFPFQVSVSLSLPCAYSSRSTTSAIGEPLRLMVKTISTWGGGSACAAAARLIASHDQLRIIAFNSHQCALDDKPVIEEPARRARVDDMLLAQHARRELIGPLLRAHRDGRLDDDRPAVELGRHEMHRAAVHLHPRRERTCGGIETGERRKQRRMDVQHAVAIAL